MLDEIDRENLSLCNDRLSADARGLSFQVEVSRVSGEEFSARARALSAEIDRGRAEFARARAMFDSLLGGGEK